MVLRNLLFSTTSDLLIPFQNNGGDEPNVCGEYGAADSVDGKLSSGLFINENIDMCLARIADTNMLIAVVKDNDLQGQAHFSIVDSNQLIVSMDIAFDLGIGDKGVIKMHFSGTTDEVVIPYSLQTQLNILGGTDSAGIHASGTRLNGRLGDFDNDGWLDGTLVSVGNIPLDSPVFPGQPYAMVRHFVLDVPVDGHYLGNVKAVLTELEH